jgi:hemolysin III
VSQHFDVDDRERHPISGFPSGSDSLEHRMEQLLTVAPAPGSRLDAAPRPRSNFRSFNFLSFENRTASRFAPLYFALFVAGQLALLLVGIRLVFRPTWNQHVQAGPAAIVGTLLVCSVVLCFGEYFFHRYLLHLETVRFLRALCSSHLTHHKLTAIRFDASGRVRSDYPITDHAHDDQSTFPSWALVPFFASFTPFFAVIAFSFPWVPILISGYAAVAIAHFLYEVLHAIHHQPYESFWLPRLSRRWSGRAWRWFYGFHLAHHANYRCNLNVAGFYGIPLADLVFGTYKRPSPLLVDGTTATSAAARALSPRPRWPISWLDRVAFKRRRRMVNER